MNVSQKERQLSEQELTALSDRISKENIKEIDEDNYREGFDLYYRIDGKIFRMCHDHDTWVVCGFEGDYPEYQ